MPTDIRLPLALASTLTLLATLGPASSGCSAVDSGALAFDAGGVPVGADSSVGRADGASGTCARGLVLCGAACIDPSLDPANCGGCGRPCAAGASCVSGACACTPGTPGCGDVIGNPGRCGAASATCGPRELCSGGACVCRPGLTRVGDLCVDLASDPTNCGTPGTRCGGGVCSAGVCGSTCAAATTRCDGACVDTDTSPLHCGECGRACSRGQICVGGGCRDYVPAGDCRMCPCPGACTGDTATCCPYPGTTAPICVGADAC